MLANFREEKGGRETSIGSLSYVPLPDQTCNPGMCLDQELNPWSFAFQSRDDALQLSHMGQGSLQCF